ncbi:hypothetical protein ACFYXV_11255 [Streptomyces sp. NPDC002181]|uniref:hypothetical protein n=1 Tax=Streptomyces sp. NPDC002181 TaxID=3364635 RepID=UPI00368A2FFB
MKNNRMIVTVVALLAIFAFSVVMVVAGQPVAAVTALIPSVALGVQQIVQAGTGVAESRREWPAAQVPAAQVPDREEEPRG